MKKFIILAFFIGITLLNIFMLFGLKRLNTAEGLEFSKEILALQGEYDVKIDLDFLQKNLSPAYE